MRTPEALTIEQVETAIDIRTGNWRGNCYAIACAIVKAKLVKGRPAYGHYTGPVSKKGYFGNRAGLPFNRHGWILLDDGRIMDPTRWVFENVKPYLYIVRQDNNNDDNEYDEGGQTLAEQLHPKELPPYDCDSKITLKVDLSRAAELHIKKLGGQSLGTRVTVEQAHWIATTSVRELGIHAKEIYKWLIKKKQRALIPIDSQTMVLGES